MGPIDADLTGDLARSLSRGQWRWVLTDEHGLMRTCGTTRVRPTGWPAGPRTRDVVELQITEALLATVKAGELGPWAPVLHDLARQHTLNDPDSERFAGDAHRRHPGATQRRWLQMRDRHCLGTGCRAPARGNQQDHTIDHAAGGPTLHWNLGGLCGHDHALKTDGGWRLTQHRPGHFRWRSRLGHVYHVSPRPIIEPLPKPLPRGPEPCPLRLPPEQNWEHDQILEDPPPEPEPPPPAQCDDPGEPPPF